MEKGEEVGKLWRPESRARLGLSLTLGLVVGIALMSIPGFVSTYQAPEASRTDAGVTPTLLALKAQPSIPSTNSTQASTANNLALAFSLFLILLPASVLSVVVRKWATRKLEEHWYY